ncbi:MAG: tail fiber protein [Bdellovibrio sp.]|nr:tail fiber protein [Bdellovibrio sp.]
MVLKILPWGFFVFFLSVAYARGDVEQLEKDLLNFVAPKVADINNVPSSETGLIVYDTGHNEFKGKKASGAFVTLGNPPGTILAFAGTTAPEGYALCDGSTVSRTQYSQLFSVIGTAFGIGNGSTTFNLPDLRGRFQRGVAGSSGRDPDVGSRSAYNGGNSGNNVGSLQADELENHIHAVNAWTSVAGASGNNAMGYSPPTPTTTRNTLPSGGLETRPLNIYLNYIIKL